MKNNIAVISVTLAGLALAGCSSSGSNSSSVPQGTGGLGYNAVVVSGGAGGGGRLAEGRISGTTDDVVVDVDGERYRFGNGSQVDRYAGVDAHLYGAGANGAALYVGDYTAAALVADNAVTNQLASVYQGQRTPTDAIPNQRATYDGLWNIGTNDGTGGANGNFNANFNFDTNRYGINLDGSNGTTGQGSGTIDRQTNTFNGNVETQGGFASNNDMRGAFFGPNRDEIGGVMAGNSGGGGETSGVFVGTKR